MRTIQYILVINLFISFLNFSCYKRNVDFTLSTIEISSYDLSEEYTNIYPHLVLYIDYFNTTNNTIELPCEGLLVYKTFSNQQKVNYDTLEFKCLHKTHKIIESVSEGKLIYITKQHSILEKYDYTYKSKDTNFYKNIMLDITNNIKYISFPGEKDLVIRSAKKPKIIFNKEGFRN